VGAQQAPHFHDIRKAPGFAGQALCHDDFLSFR
jgi:hypothetical protein